jgi:RecA-family ATPase
MAKMKVMGDMIQLSTDLTKDELERVKNFAPEALKLFDHEGNEIFGVGIGDASYSKYGICFCSETAEGKMFMTTNNPVTDHSDPAKEREEIVRYFAPIINKLQVVEANIATVRESLDAMEASVQDAVTFVE